MTSQTSLPKALPDIPIDQIKSAVETYPEVKLIIRRNTPKGTWANLPTYTMRTAELVNIADWIRETHGGGRFQVQVRNPENELEEVTARFYVEVAGAAKALDNAVQSRRPAPGPGPSRMSPGISPVPTWRGHLYPQQEKGNDLEPSDFMSQTPDAIAMEQVQALRAELHESRRRQEKREQEERERLDRERDAREKAEKDATARERAHEREMMNLRLEMIEKSHSQKPALDIVALITGLAPLGIALISSGKDRQELTVQAQQKSAELQVEGLKAMVLSGNKKDDGLEKLIGIAMPLIMQIMTEKSPSAMTKLISAMADNQLNTISMVGQLMQQMAPDNENPWMDVARKAIEGVQSVAEQMVEVQVDKKRGPAPRQVTSGTSNGASALTPQSAPTEFADAIFSAPNLPEEFKSQAWYNLFAMIHDRAAPARATALAISQQLETLADEGKLPAMFEGVLDEGPAPSSYLQRFLQQLPLAQLAPERLEQLCAEFDRVLIDDGPAVVTPPPGPKVRAGRPQAQQPNA